MTSNPLSDELDTDGQGGPTRNLAVDSITDAGALLIVAVAPEAVRDPWSSMRGAELAREWADGPTGLHVVDLSLDGGGLSPHFGIEHGEGVTDVVYFGASVGRVAHLPDGAGFRFIGPGTTTGRTSELLDHPRWSRFLLRLRAGGRRALVFLPAELDGADALMDAASTVVVLGRDEDDVAPFTSGRDSTVVELHDPRAMANTSEAGEAPELDPSESDPSDAAMPEPDESVTVASHTPDNVSTDARAASHAAASGIGAGLLAAESRPVAQARRPRRLGLTLTVVLGVVFVAATLVFASGLAAVPAFAPEFFDAWIQWVAGLFGWTPIMASLSADLPLV